MVEVKEVRMSYGRKEVLQDVSFRIESGKTVGLLGRNGAGKSTIMNILTGYLKPDAGEIYIEQTDMRKNPIDAKKKIGYLPEVPPLYKEMKVREYLLFVAGLKKLEHKKEEVETVMHTFDLTEIEGCFIGKLSKGMQQRVGLAQAFLGNPPVLILDEPLSGLDPAEAKRTREWILSIQKQHIIIISSHVLSEIEELCNDILILKDGKIAMHESKQAAKKQENNAYRILVKGDKDRIEESLAAYGSLKKIHYMGEKEDQVHAFIVVAKNTRDIRDSLFGYLVGRKFNIYGISKEETSLEDLFMNMSNREEE